MPGARRRALSGTAYGVTRLPANSVGTKQVINHSLQPVDFKPGMLQGRSGIPADSVSMRSKGAAISPTAGTDTTIIISCPEGTQVLYGGFKTWVPVFVMENDGLGADWNVILRSTGIAGPAYVYTACVKTWPISRPLIDRATCCERTLGVALRAGV